MLRRYIFLLLVGICLSAVTAQGKYSGGTGEPNDPYQIANPNDLLLLAADANDYNDCFILINDINLADYNFTGAVIGPALLQVFLMVMAIPYQI